MTQKRQENALHVKNVITYRQIKSLFFANYLHIIGFLCIFAKCQTNYKGIKKCTQNAYQQSLSVIMQLKPILYIFQSVLLWNQKKMQILNFASYPSLALKKQFLIVKIQLEYNIRVIRKLWILSQKIALTMKSKAIHRSRQIFVKNHVG